MLGSYLSVYLRARRLAGAVQLKSQLDDNMTVGNDSELIWRIDTKALDANQPDLLFCSCAILCR